MRVKQKTVSSDLPKRLKELRTLRKWSQGQVALKIGLDAQRISKYERGLIQPNADILIKIASLFGVSLDYLLRDNITSEEHANLNQIKNAELIKRLEFIKEFPEEDQQTMISVLDAFIKKNGLKKLHEQSFT